MCSTGLGRQTGPEMIPDWCHNVQAGHDASKTIPEMTPDTQRHPLTLRGAVVSGGETEERKRTRRMWAQEREAELDIIG